MENEVEIYPEVEKPASGNPNSGNRGNLFIKVLTIISAFIVLLVLASHFLLFFFAKPILQPELEKLINKDGKSRYLIQFRELKISLLTTSIYANDLLITPRYIDSFPDTSYFRISASHIELTHLDFWGLLSDKKLKASVLLIEDPFIELHSIKDSTKRKIEKKFNINQLYRVFLPVFKELNIGVFRIVNADFSLNKHKDSVTEKTRLRNFNLYFEKILIDSISHLRESKILFSDSVFIDLDNAQFGFQQANTEVSVENISVSAKNSSITLNNIILGNQIDDKINNYFRTEVDRIRLNGIRWHDLPNRIFKADSLILQNASITMNNRKAGKKTEKMSLTSLGDGFYKTVKPLFDVFTLNQIMATGFTLNAKFPVTSNIKNINIKKASVKIHHITYDRFNIKERSKFLFADNFELCLKNQEIILPKAGAMIKSDSLSVSGVTSEIYFKNLKLIPLQKLLTGNTLETSLSFPDIRIQVENLKTLILTNNFKLLSVDLLNPQINLMIPDSTKADTLEFQTKLQELIRKMNVSFPGLAIQRITIDSANFNYSNNLSALVRKSGQFTLNFQLDSFAIKKQKPNDSVYAILSDYKLDFSNINFNLGNLNFSGRKARYHLADSTLAADNVIFIQKPRGSDTINYNSDSKIVIEQLTLEKWSPVDILEQKTLISTNLKISGYSVNYISEKNNKTEDQKPRALSLPLSIDIDTVSFEKGSIYYTNRDNQLYSGFHNLNFAVRNLKSVQSKFPFEFNNLLVTLDSSVIQSSSQLNARTGHLFISDADSVITIMNPEFYFPSANPDYKNSISMYSFSFGGVSVEELYKKRIVSGDFLLFREPNIRLITGSAKIDTLGFAEKTNRFVQELTKVFPLVQIGNISIENGTFSLGSTKRPSVNYFISNGTYLKTDGLWIDSLSVVNPDEIFFSDRHQLISNWVRVYMPDSIHMISIDNVNMSTDLNELKTGKITFKPLPGNQARLKTHDHQQFETSGIDFKGFQYDRLYANSEVLIDSLLIDPPTVSIHQNGIKKEKQKTELGVNLKPIFDKFSNNLQIGHISFKDGSFKYFRPENANIPYVSLYKIETTATGLSSKQEMQNHLFNSKNIDLRFKGLKIPISDSLYNFSLASVTLSTADSSIIADSLVLIPRYSRAGFYEKTGYQTDVFDIQARRLCLSKFDFRNFAVKQDIKASVFDIDKLKGVIYRNKSLPIPADKRTKLPMSMLRSMPTMITVDTIKLTDSKLLYEEQLKDIDYPGSISFEELNLSIRNLTNDTSSFYDHKSMEGNISTRLMGKGLLEAKIVFPFDSLNDFFRIRGSLNRMSLTEFNPFLNYLAFVYIKEGYNKKTDFNIYADSLLARGKMDFRYNDLKIKLIDKKTLKSNAFEESAVSFIANLFVVRANNPKYGILRRKGKVYFERDIQKSIFSYLAKSSLSGVIATIRGSDEEKKEMRIKRREIKKLKKQGTE